MGWGGEVGGREVCGVLGTYMGWANRTLLCVQCCTWSWLLCSKITREAQAYGTIASKNLHTLAVHVARLAHGDESGAHLGARKPPARPRGRLTATHHQTMTASHGWLLFGTVCQILATEDNNLRDGESNPGCRRPTIYRTEKDTTHRKGPGVRLLQYCAVTPLNLGGGTRTAWRPYWVAVRWPPQGGCDVLAREHLPNSISQRLGCARPETKPASSRQRAFAGEFRPLVGTPLGKLAVCMRRRQHPGTVSLCPRRRPQSLRSRSHLHHHRAASPR